MLQLSMFNVFGQFDGARVYWALPKNTNIIGVHRIDAKANTILNNLNFVYKSSVIDNSQNILTYTRSQPIFKRTFYATLVIPTASLNTNIVVPNKIGGNSTTKSIFKHGLGDIRLIGTINIVGAKGLMIKDYIRHEPKSLLYFQLNLSVPTGQYDGNSAVNIGSNQIKLKLGLPFVQRIGKWVDGNKMTLELFPSYQFVSDNKSFLGNEIKQDGIFILEGHLTRDITKKGFLSLDYSYLNGADLSLIASNTNETIYEQGSIVSSIIGMTLGLKINDNINLFLSHSETILFDEQSLSIDGYLTKLTVAWSFHDFQERFKNYIEGN
ncbi:transporter [bacterium SCSIO 12643]|nr:transporter [bacterium SCSIO 12643]